jgi:anti-sigma factor RsiW
MGCQWGQKLSAYHDGELDPSARREVEAHLAQCADCQLQLAELRKMSGWLADTASGLPRLSQISLHRLHQQTQEAMEAGLIRIARVISAMAACVLLGSTLWLMRTPAAPVAMDSPAVSQASVASVGVPPWVDVTAAADRDLVAVDTNNPAAAWYLTSPSVKSDEGP